MAEKEKKGKGKEKAELPTRIRSDDVTGQYKEGEVIYKDALPENCKKAFQKIWISIRDGKEAQFKEAVEALIENSVGTVAESAPLDVYSSKPMITFGDPDTKFQLPISLLAFCGFRDRLEFAKHLIEKGASIDSGDSKIGSPLLQTMVFRDARPGRGPISMELIALFVEDFKSVLSRVITTKDDTFSNASVLTVALHMKRFDLAKYFCTEHKLHPIFGGSKEYPPLFLEYLEYGTYTFIPWLVTELYATNEELKQFIDEVTLSEVLEAGRGERSECKPGSLAEAEDRTGRCAFHAVLLCSFRKVVRFVINKKPELMKARDAAGRTAMHISSAEGGLKKCLKIMSILYTELMWEKDNIGTIPLLTAAKAGQKENAVHLVFTMMSEDNTVTDDAELIQCGLYSLKYGCSTYFEALHSTRHIVTVLSLPLDGTGNTAMHIAATRGREDLFKALLPSAIEDMISLLTVQNNDGKMPLQLAIDKGHSGIFGTLPIKNTEWRKAWQPHNNTLLFYACTYGNVELVQCITALGSRPNKKSKKGRTPLSCAAEVGNYDTVSYLLSVETIQLNKILRLVSPDGSGVDEYNPLLLAAKNDHAKVCTKLLAKGASVNKPRDPKTNYTPLMLAIDEGHKNVVIAILSDESQGIEAMQVCVHPLKAKDPDAIATPMRMLIENMPDVAEWVLNRCVTCKEQFGGEGGSNSFVHYNFKFLEDFCEDYARFPGTRVLRNINQRETWEDRKKPAASNDLELLSDKEEEALVAGETTAEEETALENEESTPQAIPVKKKKPPVSSEEMLDCVVEDFCEQTDGGGQTQDGEAVEQKNNWGPKVYNKNHHILNIMVKHKRTELLKHPLVARLLEHKWRTIAFPLFLFHISVYLVYVMALSAFALISPRPAPDSETCVVSTRGSEIHPQRTNGTCNGLSVLEIDYLYGGAVFLILLSSIYLCVEVVQMFRRKKSYFTEGENYAQLLTFILTIIFACGFGNDCWCAPAWQWQVGALAVFLAWFNLVILLKDMPFTGIPINILFNICVTFLRLAFLPVLLIISFALPFYMLFVRGMVEGDDSPGTLTSFISPPRALIKTVMQTAGELDFETIFNEANLLYSPCAYLLFITFVVVMPILFSNLLIGLAVGDTAEEIEKAIFTKTRLQVEFILELESLSSFLRSYMRPQNNQLQYGEKAGRLRRVVLVMRGMRYSDQREMVSELREKDEDFVDAIKEKGPIKELKERILALATKTAKVEEDVKMVKEGLGGAEGRLATRLEELGSGIGEVQARLGLSDDSPDAAAED